jgi:hypothetical protein
VRENVLHLTTQALEDLVVLAGDTDFDCRFLAGPRCSSRRNTRASGAACASLGRSDSTSRGVASADVVATSNCA